MKKYQWIAILLSLVFVVACGRSSEVPVGDMTAEPERVESIVERIERLDIEDVVAEIDMQLDMDSQNLNLTVKSKTKLNYTAKPNRLHIALSSIINDNENNLSTLESYADGEHMIIRTNYDPVWRKYTYENQTIDPTSMIQMYTTADFGVFYETWKDRIVLTETTEDYTITLEGTGQDFKDLVLDEMRTIQGLRVDDALFDLYMVKAVKIVHVFDKQTNEPKSMSLFMNYLFSSESISTEHMLSLDTTYLQVNEGLTLELPAEFDSLEVETVGQ